MLSVETTNAVSKVVLHGSLEAGAVAWAAHAIASPIGALGGAIFGAVRYVSQIPLVLFGMKCLNSDNPRASEAAKVLAVALRFLGSYAIAWGVLALAGFSLTVGHIVSLTVVSIFTQLALAILVSCFVDPKPQAQQ